MKDAARSEMPSPGGGPATLALVSALGTVLRFYRLGQNSLWSDEVASLRTIRVPFGEVAAAALGHNAFEPPLYFWLLHLMVGALGEGETSVRLLSALAGVLTVPVAGLLALELTRSRSVAILSAFFLAINPLHLWYSQEARPYSLLVLFGTLSLWALGRAIRTGSIWSWLGFVVAAALSMLTHVAGGFVLAIAWAWILIRRDWKTAVTLGLASAGALLLVTPSYLALAHSVANATGTGSPERPLTGLELPYTLFTYLGGYSFGPSVREIQDAGWAAAARDHLLELGAAGLVLGLLFAQTIRAASPHPGLAARLMLVALFVFPAALTWLGAVASGKAYNVRYTVLGVVGFAALVGLALRPIGRRSHAVAAALVCATFLWADAQWFFDSRYRKDDARAAVAWLHARLPDGGTVAVAPSYVRATLAHYAARSDAKLCFVGIAPDGNVPSDPAPQALLLTRLHHAPRWRELARQFGAAAGASLETGAVAGYRLALRRGDGGGATAACGAGDGGE